MTDPFGFGAQAGYYTDRETGLHLLGYRYYDSGMGRFLTRDPAGYAGGLNLYTYCGGNPVGALDPLGLAPIDLLNAAQEGAEAIKANNAQSGQPWGMVGAENTALDLLVGVLYGPLGTGDGTGRFVGDPTPKNLGWAMIDAASVGMTCAPVAEGMAAEARAGAAAAEGKFLARGVPGEVPPERLPAEPAPAQPAPSGACFTAGTVIRTETGDKPIEQIKVGDRVLSADPGTGKQSYQTVTRTFVHPAEQVLDVETEDGKVVEATPGHPFWVEGKGFTEARLLHHGDEVRREDGRDVAVEGVTAKVGKFTVYNFEVAHTHTYYAGDVWVHNACDPYAGDPFPGVSPRQGMHSPLTRIMHELFGVAAPKFLGG